uniref:Uncharacterized protein n=1 Tax=Glossina palpalis gambiensis TaxID=67801 RepID=A0A1B0BUE5_9MUSC
MTHKMEGLIILINGRDQILNMKNSSKQEIIHFLTNMPCALETDNVVDFCSLAQYSMKTPTLYGKQSEKEVNEEPCSVSQALCLPVSVYKFVENTSLEICSADAGRFLLVIYLQRFIWIRHEVEANSSAGEEHLCFMGSGRMEEDEYTHMVVASFLQKNTQYVSLLTGGYGSIHN